MKNTDDFAKDKPLLTTSIVAHMLQITPDRLRMYDTENLINVYRIETGQVKKRLYTQYDVEWLKGLRILLKDYKMSISLVKYILKLAYKNPKMQYPNDEISNIIKKLSKNPNFKTVVSKF